MIPTASVLVRSLDLAAIAIYLAAMLGTIVSSTTFLALPAAAFALDWRQLSVNLVLPREARTVAVGYHQPSPHHDLSQ